MTTTPTTTTTYKITNRCSTKYRLNSTSRCEVSSSTPSISGHRDQVSSPAGSSNFVLQRMCQKLYSRDFWWTRTGWCYTRTMTSLDAKPRPIETTWRLLTPMP
ncbi:hypothetical protein DPMN_048842 [Dreissena polymorpha]|uniref:Uncharacterized protein n=1 Tax=Dreissena polymorpha TaxID=45954 RepID=A0A9D4DCA1_DREPO|nr:hypothetical protein DPMN_048842 [Dreissena polymorpha]